MKHLYLLTVVLLSGGCVATANNYQKTYPTHVATAYSYIWKNEQNNAKELEVLLGIDPIKTEWCAAFVNAILEDSNINGSASVSKYPLTAKSFLKWGVEVDSPQIGDIVVFPRGNLGWQGHVGFYTGTTVYDNIEYYLILGGNQDQMVSVEKYRSNKAIAIRRYDS